MFRAAVCRTHGEPLTLEEVEVAAPQSGHVSVDVSAVAICHSDIMFADGGWGGPTPAIYGHEASGVVTDVGPGVDDLEPGQRVVVGLLRTCGTCFHCARGEDNLCSGNFDETTPFRAADGSPIARGLRTGAFAERTVVHRSQVVPIQAGIPPASASLLACGALTGYGSVVRTAQMPAGSTVAVIGLGGVGLSAAQGARAAGASRIVGIDVNDEKLSAAGRFGVTHAVNGADAGAIDSVRAATDGVGPDYVFVAVGAKPAIAQGMEMVRRGGTLVLVGMPASGVTTEIEIAEFADASLTIIGSKMGSGRMHEDVPALVERYQSGSLLLDEMVTNTYPLERINEAISEVRHGSVIRNVILMG